MELAYNQPIRTRGQAWETVPKSTVAESPLAYHRFMPKHRPPLPGSSPIVVGAATQFHLAVEKPNELRVAEPREDLDLVLELRKKSHVGLSLPFLTPCHLPGWSRRRKRSGHRILPSAVSNVAHLETRL
jgi:hypothetical protein